VLCASYFVLVYCRNHNLPTEDIHLSQNNIIDPENRYKQTFHIQVEVPENISQEHHKGILSAIDRCTVKKVIQQGPEFKIEIVNSLGKDSLLQYLEKPAGASETMIPGKDLALEKTIENMANRLAAIGINIEISSWRNLVPNVWSLHIRDADSPMCYTNGKGSTKYSALCSALGEFMERASCNYFYNDHYLGQEIAASAFVHYPDEKWFKPGPRDALPTGIFDEYTRGIYNPDQSLKASHLFDANSGNRERGVCARPFVRQSDKQVVYLPVNLIGNLFVSNGMSAGNTINEAMVQALSEILERGVKKRIIEEEIALPDVPQGVLDRFPGILAGIQELEDKGFPVLVKDASLGGKYPVMCVTLMNPKTGGVFASFGSHPKFEIALERSLTELLQGRSFEGLNDIISPTFNSLAVTEPNNFVSHFIDSTGVISWKFFSAKHDFEFCDWNFEGSTKAESEYLMNILTGLGKEIYVATYEDLGVAACRILVPGYSEIYQIEDLIWDNTNIALQYREDILRIHDLNDDELNALAERLEESQLENFYPIRSLIGIEFDENTVWGKLNIGELKILIYLVLERFEEAQDLVVQLLQFNENHATRVLFYKALNVVLDIQLREELRLEDYLPNLERMYGPEMMKVVVGSVTGEVRFFGLTKTSMKLEGVDKHLKLIDSYKKLHTARSTWHAASR
jgi:ribosomal protein S12 methylthiotransferase accessory factor